MSGQFLFAGAMVSAFICGCAIWRYVCGRRLRARFKSIALSAAPDMRDGVLCAMGEDSGVIRNMVKVTKAEALRGEDRSARIPEILSKSAWFEKNIGFTGLEGAVSESAYAHVRMRCSVALAAAGTVVGAVFSLELAAVMGIGGAILGWRIPKRALARRADWRSQQMEHHLPEMLDVIALGMRSGLSFDASMKLYTSYFDIPLSHELSNAYRKWTSGLETRDEALGRLAKTYRSPIFGRVVATIARSIRFGSSMAEGLEAESAEARAAYKTMREEEVAKAPVKMMVPTGVLILPAMLILVLGPVLLELMEGGF